MKLREGDIFSIPIIDKGFAFGQIVKIPNKQSLSVIVFKELFNDFDIELFENNILKRTPFLFANTFDAKFYHKHWKILGNNKSMLTEIALPYYKIGSSPVYVEDFHESKIRKATNKEVELLAFRKYVAPVRVENAVLAQHGLSEWKEDLYDPLLYSYNLLSKKLVERVE